MKQPDLQTRELEDDSHDPARSPQPTNLRSAAFGAIATLLLIALGITIFAVISTQRPAKVVAGASTAATATAALSVAVSPTAGASQLNAPKRGAGLPEGAEILAFALTGPDEGWGTAAVVTNPVDGTPDRSMIFHYSVGHWTQIGDALPGVYLGGIDMLSSSEGWVMGGDSNGKSLLLHIQNGAWQQAPLPPVDSQGAPNIMAMRTPSEGWMAMANPKGAQGVANTSLLHVSGGVWSVVRNPLVWINDIAPIANSEAWVIGLNANGTSSLVHVRGGKASVELTSPGNSTFSRLRVFAPNDIWIEGAMHAASNADINDLPLDYHFDGVAWSYQNLQAPKDAQHIDIVASNTAWSFLNVEEPPPNQTAYGQIATIYSNASGQWKTLPLPYKDLQSLKIVSNSSRDIWAIGEYMLTIQVPSSNGSQEFAGIDHYVLLHYSDGAWSEYGR